MTLEETTGGACNRADHATDKAGGPQGWRWVRPASPLLGDPR